MKRIFCAFLVLLLFSCLAQPVSALSVSAESAVLINGTTGSVLWQKNAQKPMSMASTTKIMTALLLCENADLDERLVTTKEMVTVEGSSMGLLPGDTVSYRDLLYGMMLASGNDAANTAAIALGGSVDGFVAMMNEKARLLGLENTNFVTPSGLDAAGHRSTATDMASLARHALKNSDFAAAAKSEYATLCYGNPPYKRTLKNHNKLLSSFDGLIGVKTGYTKKSGRCLVTAAKRGTAYLIAVTLSAPSDWSDHRALLEHGFTLLSERTVDGPKIAPVPVVGSNVQTLEIKTEGITLSLTDKEWAALETRIFLPHFLYSGVISGDRVGQVDYILEGETVASSEITAAGSAETAVNNDPLNKILKNFKMLLKAMI